MTEQKPPTTAEVNAKAAKDKAMSAAYGAATKTLREKYREEFDGYYQTEAKARGYDWTPPPSEKAKAKAALDKILEEHPELVDEIVGKTEDQPEEPSQAE